MSVWDDILAQPENFRNVISSHSAAPSAELERAARILKDAGRVVFTGVGSGLNATIPACVYLMEQGFPAQAIDTTEAVYRLFPGLKGSALVLNTRSGETAELIKMAHLARQAGIPTIAVTNEPESTVGRLATACIPTYSRWDDLVVISAYGGMLATELILASHVVGQSEDMLTHLNQTADVYQEVLDRVIVLRQAAVNLFGGANPVYLLGRGASIASTLGGELVLEEMGKQPAVAMAAGLFRQGPMEVVDEHFRAVVFEGTGEPAALNKHLASDLIGLQAGIYWVGPTHLDGALNLTLPDLPAYLLPLLEIIPCQVLAFDLALKKGIQPGSVRYIQRVITQETGIPNQSSG